MTETFFTFTLPKIGAVTLSASSVISFLGILASLFASSIAIIVSIKSLKQASLTIQQNKQMLEDSSRPYITIHLDAITICEQSSFFILKNFGHSPATITKFEYDPLLKNTHQRAALLNEQFDYVQGITLAPGQTKLLEYDVTKLDKDIFNFVIGYSYSGKSYEDTFLINVKNYIHIPVARPKTKISDGSERQVQTLREILERSL